VSSLAPPGLFYRRRSSLERLVLDPELEIGAGGEAVVYGLPGDAGLVAKLYHQPSIERARKLAAMLSNPPAMPPGTSIAWPADVLLLERGGFAGFLMPRADGPRVFEFYNPTTRRATAPRFHAGLLHRAGRNLAAAFDALHAAGYVVGDVNESNLLVSPADAGVTLVDADSLQVRDPETDALFRSRVGKPEFTPPELLGLSFEEVDRTPEHDRFGLAVLLFLLLMEGTHPFAMRMEATGEALPVEERIRRCLFPHASPDDDCHPPRLSPPFEALHPRLRRLFLRAFVDGHVDASARPAPSEWRDALEEAEGLLAVCAANPLHRHAPHLAECPWCVRAALLGGRDPFPANAAAAPRAPRPRRMPAPRPFAPTPPRPAPPPATVVTPFGTQPAPALPQRPGPPVPLVFGRSGVLNPLVAMGPATVVAIAGGGGPLGAFGALVLTLMLALLPFNWKRIRGATVVLALAATFAALALAVLSQGTGYADEPVLRDLGDRPDLVTPEPIEVNSGPSSEVGPTELAPPDDPTLKPLPDPLSVRDIEPFLLPDLRSLPVSAAPAALPPGGERGKVSGASVDVRLLDHLPRLENESSAAAALAGAFALSEPARMSPDTVALWIRVETDGRVSLVQELSSTSPVASHAAQLAAGYLLFAPAEKGGRFYPAWVVQRLVFVP
jgi:hypothetical protein